MFRSVILIIVPLLTVPLLSGCATPRVPADRAGEMATPTPHRIPIEAIDENESPSQLQQADERELSNSSIETVSHSVVVQTAAPLAESDLDELIAIAVANNPEIQAVRAQALMLEARIPQARALDDPMLMSTIFLDPIETAAGPQDVLLSISQKLPWFGKRNLRGETAYLDAQAAFARIASAELEVIEEIKLPYYELYFIDRAVEVNRELESRLNDVIKIVSSKFETGNQNTGLESVLQAQVELDQLQTVFVQLEQARAAAKARLGQALHAPRDSQIEVVARVGVTDIPKSADLLLALLDECQPSLEALRRESRRDLANIALADSNYFPDVTLGLNWYGIGPTGLSGIATGDDAYSLTAGVNLPIYRDKLDAATREAQLRSVRTRRNYDALWDEFRAKVVELHAHAIEHDRIAEILDQRILPRSRQALDLSIEAYRVDRISFQQLIENYKTLLRQQLDYYKRLTQREQTLASLERAVGCALTSLEDTRLTQ